MPMSPRLLRPRASAGLVGGLDADAATYINAVRNADGQWMERGVQVAISNFVAGCKTDGIWSAIKSSCILMGARTLSGALVPLVGAAPSNNSFVSGDYDRKTGLKGDAATKSLNVNRSSDADPQDNYHQSLWISQLPALPANLTALCVMGNGNSSLTGTSHVLVLNLNGTARVVFRNRSSGTGEIDGTMVTGLWGSTRSTSSSLSWRRGATTGTASVLSSTIRVGPQFVFAASAYSTTPASFMDPRVTFYSVGESLDLALLDARVSTLYTAIQAALAPTASNADAQDWINRVYANGGTVSTSTAAAVNDFCNAMDAGVGGVSMRDRFYRLNLFCGTGLTAALVPLYRGQSRTGPQFGSTTDTNAGGLFVSGDYVETGATGGLVGGTTKYLNTGLATDVMPAISSFHLSQSVRDREAAGAGRSFIGMNDTLASQIVALRQEGTTGNIGGLIARTTPTTMAYAAADSHAMVTRTSLTLLTMYRSGVSQATDVNTITVASSSRPLFVFCRNSTGVPTDFTGLRARMYSIGLGMDGTQAASFAAAVAAFNTALGRT